MLTVNYNGALLCVGARAVINTGNNIRYWCRLYSTLCCDLNAVSVNTNRSFCDMLPQSSSVSVYACGWLKRGPTGIVATNKLDAADTIAAGVVL
jgi:hypothetical protein